MDPVAPYQEDQEPITVTRDEIIHHRRVRVLEHAGETGNIALTCRTFGISRKTFYEWQGVARRYGLEALMPKARRRPQLANATPTHVLHELLALAMAEPTLGCRQLGDRLADRGFVVSNTTVQKLLVDHGLGRRSQRLARAAALAALVSGLVTEAVADEAAFGFCHFAARPGDLVAIDSFYIGNLKGVGKVYQLTAIDTATRWAVLQIVLGPVTAEHTRRFITHVQRSFRRVGWPMGAVLSDNGPEYAALRFKEHLSDLGLTHHRIPPRSPNHNAVCERFQGTALQECWRPAFHRRRFTSIRQLQAEADAWLQGYHHRRRNHGDFMRGRTPRQVLTEHDAKRAS
jgi:transposase InsO family protein/molybdenum-dependent DNA-binding transcriptional regulator ModE